MSPVRGAGHFVAWDGGCLLIGRAHEIVSLHAHYALQIGFGREPGIGFRADESDGWTTYDVAVIPSRQPHEMDATRVTPMAVLLIEPETHAGRLITERYLQGGTCNVSNPALRARTEALFTAWESRRHSAVTNAAADVISALSGEAPPSAPTDPRVLRAIVYINAKLTGPLTLDDAAAEACLSPSRFRHLFVEETGMGFRPFVLWRRFLRAWELICSGASLSTAAHAAGFADAAHLTRTSRQMFGFPPSALQFAEPLTDSPDVPATTGYRPR